MGEMDRLSLAYACRSAARGHTHAHAKMAVIMTMTQTGCFCHVGTDTTQQHCKSSQ